MTIPPDPWDFAMLLVWQSRLGPDERDSFHRNVVNALRCIARDCIDPAQGGEIAALADQVETVANQPRPGDIGRDLH